MNNTINQLEQIDQQLEEMDSQSLLLVGNIVGWGKEVELTEVAKILSEIISLPQSLQSTVLDSIHAKIKAR